MAGDSAALGCFQIQHGVPLEVPGPAKHSVSGPVHHFEREPEKLVFLGGDCPYVNETRLNEAFAAFDEHDVVVGPARDGGYYLIGVNAHFPQLFQGIPWGSDSVFPSTLDICRRHGLGFALLPGESDVDDVESWRLAKTFGFMDGQ